MINTYFIEIAAVRMAAGLLGKELCDNYAFHGVLPKFASIEIGNIMETDGIDDVPQKAESFIFGQVCGGFIDKALADYSAEKRLYCEACIAKAVLLRLTPRAIAKYSQAELKQSIETIFHALVKRAQIRTHTAKPGNENINAWLASYYSLERGYSGGVTALVDVIVNPDQSLEVEYTTGFFDKNDALIALAMQQGTPRKEDLIESASTEAVSVFGGILRDITSCLLSDELK